MRLALIITAIVATTAITPAHAQLTGRDRWADSARVQIEQANVRGNLDQLRASRVLIDRALTAFAGDPLLEHYAAYALYREATLLMARNGAKESVYRPLLEEADSLLERSASKLQLPETYALRSAVLGQLIGSNPLRGMSLGPKSGKAMDRAMEVGPDNPRVWLMSGIGAMFTPGMFGGGLEKSEAHLRKAIALFTTDQPAPPLPAWGHAEAYVWLGQALHKSKRTEDARAAYAKALELDPDNGWVRDVLVPALDRSERGRR